MIQINNEIKNITILGCLSNKIKTLEPFDKYTCLFLDDLSAQILKIDKKNLHPDLIVFAFWIRKKNILRLKSKYLDKHFRLGRGLIFHIAPSNVPINFAYSLVFGLLSGNSNIIRIPSKQFIQVEIIINAISKLLKNKKYKMFNSMIQL